MAVRRPRHRQLTRLAGQPRSGHLGTPWAVTSYPCHGGRRGKVEYLRSARMPPRTV
ncbi:hypothetical protein O0544_06700 [Edwardsiella anguillarum]|nr:hypothetical protein [Edwardsiella anguillarum]